MANSNLPERKPSVVLINASNEVKTKIVEQVKQELTNCLGGCTMFVAVEK